MRRFGFLLMVGLVGLVAIVVWKTLSFRSEQPHVMPVTEISLDEQGAARRLGGALRFATVSYQEPELVEPSTFTALHGYLEEAYPLLHATLQKETVAELSLLFTWPGRDSQLKPVLLLGHLDVVPVEPASTEAWSFEPFTGAVADGFILGRGRLTTRAASWR